MAVRYLVVLGLLTILCTASYKIIVKSMERLEKASSQMMLTSRQSVLSERIAGLSSRLVYEKDATLRESAKNQLNNAAAMMADSQRQLIDGNRETGSNEKISVAASTILYSSPIYLDELVNEYVAHANSLAGTPIDKISASNPDYVYIRTAERNLQAGLNELQNQYRAESGFYMKRLRYIEAGVLAAFISILILMGIFVFYPMVRRIQRENDKLKENEEYTREILQTAADGVISADDNGNISSFNRAAERMFGYTASEAVQKNIKSLLGVPESSRSLKSGEKIARRRDGSTFPIDLSVNDTHVNNKHIYICVVRDITERKSAEDALLRARDTLEDRVKERTSELTKTNALLKQEIVEKENAQQALRESERRFRTMADTAPVMIWMAGPDKLNSYFNKVWLEFRGKRLEHETGAGWTEGIHPEDRQRVLEIRNAAFQNKREFSVEYRLKNAAGRYIKVIDHGAPRILHDGSFAGFVGSVLDITGVQEAEEEVTRSQKLDSLGVLAGRIAHDFNNIMTSITSNASVAKKLLSEGDPARQCLADIESASERGKKLAQRYLTFSKGGSPATKTVTLPQILKDASEDVLKDSSCSLEYSFPDTLWRVEADPDQLSQAIGNIVKNARESMTGKGSVRVEAENVRIKNRPGASQESPDYVKISIKDRGRGISEKNLGKIFDPYFTTKDQASGLGLTAAYSIVKNHGGYLTVESDPAAGTTFYVYLPAAGKKLVKTREVASTAVKSNGSCEPRVLLMDDEKMIREAAAKALKLIGYKAEFAENGRKAIDLFNKAKDCGDGYDAVILDLTIPDGMGGEETLKKLLKIDPEVKAIATSGYAEGRVMSDYRRYGFVAAVSKPYSADDLKNVLSSVVGTS